MSQLLLDRTTTSPTACPDCTDYTDDVINVQGIETCAACGWVDR